jgi:hypothetical protein
LPVIEQLIKIKRTLRSIAMLLELGLIKKLASSTVQQSLPAKVLLARRVQFTAADFQGRLSKQFTE